MSSVVGVSFKENGRTYYFKNTEVPLNYGDNAIVNTEKGQQFVTVVVAEKEISEKDFGMPLKSVLRKATKDDVNIYKKNVADATDAIEEAKKIIEKLKLDMHIYDASFTFDRSQLMFNFLSDNRIDFRELAKKLAQLYHTRIELRQIGVRDRAREIGGLGPCGRFFCCSTFLTSFESISINMAKNQFLALNPTKINGVCGRLLCCLNYEDGLYTELKKEIPYVGSFVETKEGRGKVVFANIFTKKLNVELNDKNTIISINASDLKTRK